MAAFLNWFRRAKASQPPAHEVARTHLHLGNKLLAAGRLEDAALVYEQSLAVETSDTDACVNLGFVLKELGKTDKARQYLERALQINPDLEEAHFLLAQVVALQGNSEGACHHFAAAVAIKPGFGVAWQELCRLHLAAGRVEDARLAAERALVVDPQCAYLHHFLGDLDFNAKAYPAAVESYERVLAITPDSAQALCDRGNALHELKRFEDAIDSYDQAISIDSKYAEAHRNRGIALRGMKRLGEALESWERAIRLEPDFPDIYNWRAGVLVAMGLLEEGLASAKRAAFLDPKCADAYNSQTIALVALKRFEDALEVCDQAIFLKPEVAEAHNNRGCALDGLSRLDEALESYNEAIRLNLDFAEAHNNRGSALRGLNRLDEALESYRRAIELNPDFAEAHWNEGLNRLLLGDLKSGWEKFEWRWKRKSNQDSSRSPQQPRWHGVENLKGATILLYAEQGLGDTIQFYRYVQKVVSLGATVVLDIPTPLHCVFSDLKASVFLRYDSDSPTVFDYQCPLMSLPLAFKTELEDIAGAAYLSAQAEKIAVWQQVIGEQRRPRVGIVWAGNSAHTNDKNRSIPFSVFQSVLVPGVDYFCLQNQIKDTDKGLLSQHAEINTPETELKDFADTAALIELMDLVITVDTSVAHLAGAMGKDVWILLPFVPDWRWLLNRTDSPWYTSATLFRQPAVGDWHSALRAAKNATAMRFFAKATAH